VNEILNGQVSVDKAMGPYRTQQPATTVVCGNCGQSFVTPGTSTFCPTCARATELAMIADAAMGGGAGLMRGLVS